MKCLTHIFFIISIFFLSACSTDVKEGNANTFYVDNQDTTVVIYKHEALYPVILRKPILTDTLLKYGIDTEITKSSMKQQGMRRYVNGRENNVYRESIITFSYIIISTVLLMASLLIISKNPN